MSAGNPRCRIRNARSDGLSPVIPANYHDLSFTAEHESAAIVSGATDVFRLAALIRACRFLPDSRWISAARRPDVADVPPARPGTDEPHEARGTSVAPRFHQILHNDALSGKRRNPGSGTRTRSRGYGAIPTNGTRILAMIVFGLK